MLKNLIELFLVFARIGAFTFGGGYAMLPLIQEEVVNKRGWVTEEEVLDYYAIGQMTPGIIAVNTATFIGYKRGGLLGAISATLGVVAPSIVIITAIATVFDTLMESSIVDRAFNGIRIVVVALMASGVAGLSKKSLIDNLTKTLFFAAIAIMLIFSPSPITIVVATGIIGILSNRKVDTEK